MKRRKIYIAFFLAGILCAGFFIDISALPERDGNQISNTEQAVFSGLSTTSVAKRIVSSARGQIGKTVIYDPSYIRLNYPEGDIPIERGVCTDVLIRALREALDMDLQKLVHEDMKNNFTAYPSTWGLRKPDPNIDHRRVLNLQKYFEREGWSLGVTNNKNNYFAGDIVTCIVPPNLPHVMIVSDRKDVSFTPLIIHNIGTGTKEESRLFEFRLTGHYRIHGDLE